MKRILTTLNGCNELLPCSIHSWIMFKKEKNEGVTAINHIGGTKCIDTQSIIVIRILLYDY